MDVQPFAPIRSNVRIRMMMKSYLRLKNDPNELFNPIDLSNSFVIKGGQWVVFENIYPVPTSDILNFEIKSAKAAESEIVFLDPFGKEVYRKELSLTKGINQLTVDISNLSNGLYTVSLISGDLRVQERIIKVE